MIDHMKIIVNEKIAKDTFLCIVQGELVQEIKAPGQFVQVRIDGVYLRRPLSIADYDKEHNELTFIYKVVGEGTELLAKYQEGQILDCFGPLGTGFDLSKIADVEDVVVTGGGIGVPPLLGLVRRMKDMYPEKRVQVVLGFQTAEYVFYEEIFNAFYPTVVATDDGSNGLAAGNALDVMATMEEVKYVFACGPGGMLQALEKKYAHIEKQISFEERMACGTGICMGCVRVAEDGSYTRICKEGPVLQLGGQMYE